MTSLIPWKGKKAELARKAGELAAWPASSHPLAEFNGEGWRWGLEVEDEDDSVVVRAEAPGFDAGDFDLHVEDNRLVLRASKKVETKDETGKVQEYREQEYREQECYESVALPVGIDNDKVDAQYDNGLLTVTLPKTAACKAERIAVEAR